MRLLLSQSLEQQEEVERGVKFNQHQLVQEIFVFGETSTSLDDGTFYRLTRSPVQGCTVYESANFCNDT